MAQHPTANFFRFRIIDIILNRTVTEWGRIRGGTLFWTPPIGSIFWLVFDNPFSTPTNLSIVIKEYYLLHSVIRETTLYRPFLDQSQTYIGIGLIISAIILDLSILGHEEFQAYKKKLEEGKIQDYKALPVKD